MPDFTVTVNVTRTQLGLSDLNINDGVNYKISGADQFVQGAVTWERDTTRSPYVEGEFTTNRRRGNVQERLGIEVFKGNSAGISGQGKFALEANIQQLIQAFTQDAFVLNMTAASGTTWQNEWHWACEAADYSVVITGPRLASQQALVTFTVIRNPVATDLTWSAW